MNRFFKALACSSIVMMSACTSLDVYDNHSDYLFYEAMDEDANWRFQQRMALIQQKTSSIELIVTSFADPTEKKTFNFTRKAEWDKLFFKWCKVEQWYELKPTGKPIPPPAPPEFTYQLRFLSPTGNCLLELEGPIFLNGYNYSENTEKPDANSMVSLFAEAFSLIEE